MKIAYSIVLATDKFVVVTDECELNRCMSLTNGAEQLVKELHQKGLLKEGMRLGYYDTDHNLDEINFTPAVWESEANCTFSGGFPSYHELMSL